MQNRLVQELRRNVSNLSYKYQMTYPPHKLLVLKEFVATSRPMRVMKTLKDHVMSRKFGNHTLSKMVGVTNGGKSGKSKKFSTDSKDIETNSAKVEKPKAGSYKEESNTEVSEEAMNRHHPFDVSPFSFEDLINSKWR